MPIDQENQTEQTPERVRSMPVGEWDDYKITLGELARGMQELKRELSHDMADLRMQIAGNLVPREVYEAKHQALIERVTRLESDRAGASAKWWTLGVGVVAALAASGASILLTHIH